MRSDYKTHTRAKALRQRMTDAELILWSRIRPRAWPQHRFRRQVPIGPYIADFACPLARTVIEVDGATHASDEERAHDARRDHFMRERGWNVIRISNEDVYRALDETLDSIARQMPPPTRRLRGGPPPP